VSPHTHTHTHTHTHSHSHTHELWSGRLLNSVSSTAELVTKLYEAAVKKVPLSEEYHSHLFMAYARVGEYKKMQQVRNSREYKDGGVIRVLKRGC